jgi:hypothetical protein
MKLMRLFVVIALVVMLAAAFFFSAARAQDTLVGTWVLDPAKNQGPPGVVPTAGTATITAERDGKYTSVSEVTVGGVTGGSEITYSVDGKDYAVVTTPAQPGVSLTQSLERVSATVWSSNVKLNGQLMATVKTELSSDGNTLTQATTGVGQFAALSSTVVFNRD